MYRINVKCVGFGKDMAITLTIGGLPICGAVGCDITITKSACWDIYHKWVTLQAEKDAQLCVLRRFAAWSINGQSIDEPNGYFLTLQDVPNGEGKGLATTDSDKGDEA